MQGEFRSDVTRNTFDSQKHLTRVLMQQGRVQIDADWNEQVSILLHYLQTLAEDIFGSHGGPISRSGFNITFNQEEDVHNNAMKRFNISQGHYYVHGILCENENNISYYKQQDYPLNEDQDKLPDVPFLVYLDVWERHLNYIQDANIVEVALGGADTASRAQIVWQVKVTELDENINKCEDIEWEKLIEKWQSQNRGLLKAKAKQDQEQTDACSIPPSANFRGADNQLYRVEIHQVTTEKVTFKWSRENSSVAFPLDIDSNSPPGTGGTSVIVKLKQWWHDDRFGLAVGDWVEIVDDDSILHNSTEPLWKVDSINSGDFLITLKRQHKSHGTVAQDAKKHPLLRRWEQKETLGAHLIDGAVPIVEVKSDSDDWITLEDGVQIQFQKPSSGEHSYRAGDYWLIPARTATGDVEWFKSEDGKSIAVPPHGIEHRYAPLAIIVNGLSVPEDCRLPKSKKD